jgi:hypothetical protein
MRNSTITKLYCVVLLVPSMAAAQLRDEQESGNRWRLERNRQCTDKSLELPPAQRSAFMANCLKQGQAPTEQEKGRLKLGMECREKAGARTGEERKRFMDSCMGRSGPSTALSDDQKQRQAQALENACNKQADAQKLSGSDRRKFMRACRRGEAPQAAAAARHYNDDDCARKGKGKGWAKGHEKKDC